MVAPVLILFLARQDQKGWTINLSINDFQQFM
jgi:hypothetical protein